MNTSKQMRRGQQRSNPGRIVVATLAIALLLAACGNSDSDSPASFDDRDQQGAPTTLAPSAGGDNGGAEQPEAGLGSGAIGEPAQAPLTTGRDIIFTAEMTVSVDDVGQATSEAVRIVESFRGFIFGQRTVGGPEPTTILVFKVPPARFQEVLAALGDVGEIRTQTISADDVTDRIVDLESRISTAETSVERLRTLLEEASAIKTITELESQLLERETLLEQLRGQLRTVQDQVALATITVQLTQAEARPAIEVKPTAYVGFEDEGTSCPGQNPLSVVEGETVTFCLEIFNVGDTPISSIDVRDAVIDKDLADFIVVFGDLESPLEPGQSVVLATPVELERTTRSRTRVSATPLNEDGTILEGRSLSNTSTITLSAEDPGGVPGFSEGLHRSWEVLIDFAKVLILGIGIAIPFLWVIGLAWLYLRWRRNRAAERQAALARARATIPAPVPTTPEAAIPEEAESGEANVPEVEEVLDFGDDE